jgi:hypothetical protein
MYIYDSISLNSSENEKYLNKRCRDNQKAHFVFNNFSKNHAVYEIMWKNVVEPDTSQMTM